MSVAMPYGHEQTSSTLVLDRLLDPLKPYIEKPSVTELMVNSDGSVWIDDAGELTKTDLVLSTQQRFSITRSLAGYYDLVCTRDSPTLSCRLPVIYPGRVQAVVPPITYGPEICIRFPSRTKLTLEDLIERRTVTKFQAKQLASFVYAKENIVIAGGTGSGKTTLATALLDLILDERLCIIEDTPEIVLNNENTNYWLTNPTFTARDAVKAALRFRPDRIILGEVRDGAALEWCKAAQSGHNGSVCTVHASSADGVRRRMYALMQEVVLTPSDELLDAALEHLVFIEKVNGQRKVQTILTPKTFSKETKQ
jgi:type IV secretion system protein VirB11